jgi:hypothetical protein
MELNKVVVRFRNGKIMKGKTHDFLPNNAHFNIETLEGEIKVIDIEKLKAIFFVKDCDGNGQHRDDYGCILPGAGIRVRVTFFDDEVVIGYSLGYFANPHGFFMRPADAQGNNNLVFVIRSSIKAVEIIESSFHHPSRASGLTY